jgi:uncharacterized protein (TIGR02300 family)
LKGPRVPKAELGEKQVCPSCASKFYDLRKRPAVCPKCSFQFDPTDEVVKLKRIKSSRTPVYETEDDEEEVDKKKRVVDGEDGFEEVEETRELDAEAVEDAPDVVDDEDVDPDAIPPGFSETEEEGLADEDAPEEDDGVPLLEDDEEFPDDELGEVDDGAPDEEDR